MAYIGSGDIRKSYFVYPYFFEKAVHLVSSLTLVCMLSCVILCLENRVVLAAEKAEQDKNEDGKIITDLLKSTEERIWSLETRLESHPTDAASRDDLRGLKDKRRQLESQVKQDDKSVSKQTGTPDVKSSETGTR